MLYFTCLCLGSRISSSLVFSGVCVSGGRETTLFTHTFSKSKHSFSLSAGSRGLKHYRSKIKHWKVMKEPPVEENAGKPHLFVFLCDKHSHCFYFLTRCTFGLYSMCVLLCAFQLQFCDFDLSFINENVIT